MLLCRMYLRYVDFRSDRLLFHCMPFYIFLYLVPLFSKEGVGEIYPMLIFFQISLNPSLIKREVDLISGDSTQFYLNLRLL